jgi:hypothetical protein
VNAGAKPVISAGIPIIAATVAEPACISHVKSVRRSIPFNLRRGLPTAEISNDCHGWERRNVVTGVFSHDGPLARLSVARIVLKKRLIGRYRLMSRQKMPDTEVEAHPMSQINPFINSILQAPSVQRAQAADKDRLIRRIHDVEKNAALEGDQQQHEVESAEAVSPVQDDQPRRPPLRKRPRRRSNETLPDEPDDESHIDVTA